MKVLLIKDVYKLGHAGDVKKVADGFGRNFLVPQGLAVLATVGAMRQIETIRNKANERRSLLNQEMGVIAEALKGVKVGFATKAGETGKLYGSITNQMVADAINAKLGLKIERHQVEMQPIRKLGEFKARVRLTVDINPEVVVIAYREGETPVGMEAPVVPAETPAA